MSEIVANVHGKACSPNSAEGFLAELLKPFSEQQGTLVWRGRRNVRGRVADREIEMVDGQGTCQVVRVNRVSESTLEFTLETGPQLDRNYRGEQWAFTAIDNIRGGCDVEIYAVERWATAEKRGWFGGGTTVVSRPADNVRTAFRDLGISDVRFVEGPEELRAQPAVG